MQLSGLTVRQHERSGIKLPAELTVCEAHRAQVRFSSSSSAECEHIIKATVVDISAGGMGIELPYYLPRNCELEARLVEPDAVDRSAGMPPPPPSPARAAGEGVEQPLLVQRVRVRRVQMIGAAPAYAVGMAFIDPPDDIERQIAALFARFAPHMNQQGGVNARS